MSYGEAILIVEFVKDLGGYVAERKKFVLVPLIVIFALLGALLIAAHGSAVAPFIYTLF